MSKGITDRIKLFELGKIRMDEKLFSDVFAFYYKDFVMYGSTFISNRQICEDIVQDVFGKLWMERDKLMIGIALKSYLFRMVRNRCLDKLKHDKIVAKHATYSKHTLSINHDHPESYVLYSELYGHVDELLRQLPERERSIFEMSRLEKFKYVEIAGKMNISQRTIEASVSKVVKHLRAGLKDFLPVLGAILAFKF